MPCYFQNDDCIARILSLFQNTTDKVTGINVLEYVYVSSMDSYSQVAMDLGGNRPVGN